MPEKTEVVIGKAVLELVLGDITRQAVDAIVNAANEGLRGGGGVDGAIHRAGGPAIMAACRQIGRCPTGGAVWTTAGKLQAKGVIHTVGPVWQGGGSAEAQALASCYRSSLELAAEQGCRSIAFPSISTGVYRYPVDLAANAALGAVIDFLRTSDVFSLIRFVLFDEETMNGYSKVLVNRA